MCEVGGGASLGRIPGRIPGTRCSNLRLDLNSTALTRRSPCPHSHKRFIIYRFGRPAGRPYNVSVDYIYLKATALHLDSMVYRRVISSQAQSQSDRF